MVTTTRPEFLLPGATRALDAVAQRGDVHPGVAAARALCRADVRWQQAHEAIAATLSSVILGRHADGSTLAGRWFDPARPTTLHDHGVAGAVLVTQGCLRYERFRREGGRDVRLESIHDLAAGDVFWWGPPPDDVHRLTALHEGAIALLLLTGPPTPGASFDEIPRVDDPLRDTVERAWTAGDVEVLRPLYHPDALADIGVPQWRFQIRGRDDILLALADGEFAQADRRVHELRTTATASGLLLEVETRYREDGQTRHCREAHHLRCRDGLVVEHVIWCTGVADAEQIADQLANAPMERA